MLQAMLKSTKEFLNFLFHGQFSSILSLIAVANFFNVFFAGCFPILYILFISNAVLSGAKLYVDLRENGHNFSCYYSTFLFQMRDFICKIRFRWLIPIAKKFFNLRHQLTLSEVWNGVCIWYSIKAYFLLLYFSYARNSIEEEKSHWRLKRVSMMLPHYSRNSSVTCQNP